MKRSLLAAVFILGALVAPSWQTTAAPAAFDCPYTCEELVMACDNNYKPWLCLLETADALWWVCGEEHDTAEIVACLQQAAVERLPSLQTEEEERREKK